MYFIQIKKDPLPYTIRHKSSPQLLKFEELKSLLMEPERKSQASIKMKKLFKSPFIDNSYYKEKGIPKPSSYDKLGSAIRISTWNIEKSMQVKELVASLQSETAFKSNLSERALDSPKLSKKSRQQLETWASSEIILLQEMDIGHCRSDYLFAAKHLAKTIGLNYVYAPQQLEVDPVYLGLENEVKFANTDLSKSYGNDDERQKKYRGVFGVAVLSKYPIKRVQAFPLKSDPYDWYKGETPKPDLLEKGRRLASKTVFQHRIAREVKLGRHGFTRVDLHVPNVPHETISVINIHLEIKTPPQKRLEQMKEILGYIKEIKNPVVMAGDFNNASRDISSTSIPRFTSRTLSDPAALFSAGMLLADATGINQVRSTLAILKNFKNPLAIDIPVVMPNRKKSLFKLIENYRFADGGAFDFRGDKQRSLNGTSGTLSNSNQRYRFKGFTFTFSVPTPVGPIGQDRLDWIFVKSFLTHPKDKTGPYRLAPHFGQTLSLINRTAKQPYSDHHPITTLLPLGEPNLK